ncbi:hypothetical protein [Mycobacterium malmoense]|uniref:hypothetical protein n=1 Tax=Mycobacterium malmoense TaxID=1780 RepID=UPI0011465A43|nr:hypothetical protein [Mycobacterium malmoense]
MTRPNWLPSQELLAAITKATTGFIPPAPDFRATSSLRQVIGKVAEQHRRALETVFERQQRVFDDARKMVSAAMPANLRDIEELSALEDIVEKEGIPLAHVPRSEIVRELLDAPDYEARRAVLEARLREAVEDCLTLLSDPLDDLDDDAIRIVAIKSAQALADGPRGRAGAGGSCQRTVH